MFEQVIKSNPNFPSLSDSLTELSIPPSDEIRNTEPTSTSVPTTPSNGPRAEPPNPQREPERHATPVEPREPQYDPFAEKEGEYIPTIRDTRREPDFRYETSPIKRLEMATELAGTIDRVMPDRSVSYYTISHSTRYKYISYYTDSTNSTNYRSTKSSPLLSHAAQVSLKKPTKVYPRETRMALTGEVDGLLHREVWTGVVKSNVQNSKFSKSYKYYCQ